MQMIYLEEIILLECGPVLNPKNLLKKRSDGSDKSCKEGGGDDKCLEESSPVTSHPCVNILSDTSLEFFSMDGNQTTSHAKKRKSDESLLINNPDEVKGVAMEALEPSSTA
jgi:hypothetical protein